MSTKTKTQLRGLQVSDRKYISKKSVLNATKRSLLTCEVTERKRDASGQKQCTAQENFIAPHCLQIATEKHRTASRLSWPKEQILSQEEGQN